MTPLVAFFSLLACAPKVGDLSLASLAESSPVLPAPEANVYARGSGAISDAAVAAVVEGLHWDEALSGAAGALALAIVQGDDPSAWAARWAGYRAGYPHLVQDLGVYPTEPGSVPPLLVEVLGAVDSTTDVGLARARGYSADTWVLLTARVGVEIAPFSRVLGLGETVELQVASPDGVDVQWVSPDGVVDRFPLVEQAAFALEQDGEWWLQLFRDQATLLAVPVVVGIEPPDLPPLYGLSAEATAVDALVALRTEFEAPPPTEDPILAGEARARVRRLVDATAPNGAGWRAEPGQCSGILTCTYGAQSDVGLCFERWLIEGSTRSLLVDPRCDLVGAAELEATNGQHAVLVLGSSPG